MNALVIQADFGNRWLCAIVRVAPENGGALLEYIIAAAAAVCERLALGLGVASLRSIPILLHYIGENVPSVLCVLVFCCRYRHGRC